MKLTVSSLNGCQYKEVIEFLLNQQLYNKPNLIDRTSQKKLKVSIGEEILKELQNKIFLLTPLWTAENYDEFIKQLCTILGIDDRTVFNFYNSKVSNLPEENNDQCLKFMFALGEAIHYLHEQVIKEAHYILKEKVNLPEEKFNNAISILSQNSDVDLSIFQNYHILKKYGEITGYKINNILIAKTIHRIIEKIKNSKLLE